MDNIVTRDNIDKIQSTKLLSKVLNIKDLDTLDIFWGMKGQEQKGEYLFIKRNVFMSLLVLIRILNQEKSGQNSRVARF